MLDTIGAPAAWVAEDRTLRVEPGQVVESAWIDIAQCVLANRARMSLEAVEAKYRRLLCQGEAAVWPPITGYWQADGRFLVCDGRHEYVAALIAGRAAVLVAWIRTAITLPAVP